MTIQELQEPHNLETYVNAKLICDRCGDTALIDDAPEGWAVVGSDEPFTCDIDETDIHLCAECAQEYNR